jgi:hypothetical protein
MFGGVSGNTLLGDLWEWNGTRWHRVSTRTGPSPRIGAALVYDAARRVLVLFGGSGLDSSDDVYGDTWESKGSTWTERTLSSKLDPHPRAEHSMAYDRKRGKVLLYGATQAPYDVRKPGPWEYSPNRLGARVLHDEAAGGDLGGDLGPLAPGSNHVVGLIESADFFDGVGFSVPPGHRLDRVVISAFRPRIVPDAFFVELFTDGFSERSERVASAFAGVGGGGGGGSSESSGVGSDVLRGLPSAPGPLPEGAYELSLGMLRSPEVEGEAPPEAIWGVDLQVVPLP